MKIFLDTADTEIIRNYFETGLVDGVTTNPSLIMKSGRDPEDVYQEIKDIGVQDISMEVVGFGKGLGCRNARGAALGSICRWIACKGWQYQHA